MKVGNARPATKPAEVAILTTMPPGAEQLGFVEAHTTGGFGQQGWMDSATENLKELAAEVGANGVVVTGMGSGPSGAILTGVGTGGPVMAIPTQGKPIIHGVAVYVPK